MVQTGLDLLHLGNNRIAIIHDKTFGQLIHLRRLYLNGNLIERLTEDMFYGLQSLQFLYLEYNVIREIAVGAFQQVPNLQLLFLNNNLLKTLPLGVFDGLSLARLNLRSNHLRTLSGWRRSRRPNGAGADRSLREPLGLLVSRGGDEKLVGAAQHWYRGEQCRLWISAESLGRGYAIRSRISSLPGKLKRAIFCRAALGGILSW